MSETELILGEPMSIREVARLIGCSPWSVRQTLLPKGLPHWRSGPSGKLIFYRDQVVRWLIRQQEQRKPLRLHSSHNRPAVRAKDRRKEEHGASV